MSYVTPEPVNTDFSQRVVLDTTTLPWNPSPQIGVERRFLDRVGDEVARATSLVRYAPGSEFPSHTHGGGEEFYVLDGIFSDENGDYPAGSYVRNPPGTAHAPSTKDGCIILVKLRQMIPVGEAPVVIDTNRIDWCTTNIAGLSEMPLFEPTDGRERVALEKLDPGTDLAPRRNDDGEEIFVLQGTFADDSANYAAGTWIRNPIHHRQSMRSEHGCILWVKRGHLST